MGFNPFNKGSWDNLGNQIRGGGDQAIRALNDAANQVRGAAEDALNRIRSEGDGAIHAVKNEASQLENKVKNLINQIEGKGQEMISNVHSVGENTVNNVKTTGENAVTLVRGELQKIPESAEDAVENIVKNVVASLQSKAFEKFLKVVESFSPTEVGLVLGPFEIAVENPKERVEYLVNLKDHPPTDKDGIVGLLKDLAPDTVKLNLTVEVAIVFLSIDALSIGGWVTVNTQQVIEKIGEVV